ncbi:MAG TPA: acetylglutamate kinase [Methanomassiliicoccales archaeon]|nr:acetylglutamate kinase [Methanomassiliicoccales archaeon]
MNLNAMTQSFPRIWKLRGKKILIKFGGNSLNGNGDLERISNDIALLVSLGLKPIVVHGGGPNISKEMEARGLEVKKVAGLRITDDKAIHVVKDVLSKINDQIVDALKATGVKAIGISGSEGKTVMCEKKDPVEVEENGTRLKVDLGNVGEVKCIDPTTVSVLCASGFVPVIYPICVDQSGREMNVNADTVAAHLAKALGCEEMVLVTDVPGVMREIGNMDTLITDITIAEMDHLIEIGIVSGGMLPKVEACRLAIENGVKKAHMVNGREPNSIFNQVLMGSNCGTTVRVN